MLTYDECMRRLMAYPALPRGERMPACVNKPRTLWVGRGSWPLCQTWYLAWKGDTKTWKRQADSLRRAREERQKWKRRALELAPLMGEVHRLQCQGAFSLERDPFNLIPAIDAYAAEEISGGKMREYIRRWLAGESFRVSGTLDHESAFARLKDGE